jgi:hypothetical protein
MTMTHQHHRDHQDRPELGRDERTPGTGPSRSTPEQPGRCRPLAVRERPACQSASAAVTKMVGSASASGSDRINDL